MTPGNHVSRNFAVLSAGQMASRILAFVTTIHVAQVLLQERFGAIAFATGILLYAGVLVDFGFDNFGPIEISRGTSPIKKLAGIVLTFRSMLVLPAFGILCAFANLVPLAPISRTMIELYGLSLATNALDLTWVFLGGKHMWPAVVAEIITQISVAIGAYVFIHSPQDAFLMPVSFIVGRAIAVTFLLTMFIKTWGVPKLGIDWTYLKKLLAGAVPLCGSQVMAMISNNFDLMIIGVWLTMSDAGLYGAATRVVWVPTTICIAYYTALRPLVAQAYVHGFANVEETFKRSVRITTALALGVVCGGILLARPVMIQMFGANYGSASGALIFLMCAFGLMLVSRNYRLVLVTFNQQSTDLRIMTLAAVVNIGLNILLIKPLGITGAALATLASEAVILVLDYFMTRRLISHVPLGRYIWRPLLCCAIMATVVTLSEPINSVWARVAIGGSVYAILMWLFGIVTTEELKSWSELLVPAKFRSKGSTTHSPANEPMQAVLPESAKVKSDETVDTQIQSSGHAENQKISNAEKQRRPDLETPSEQSPAHALSSAAKGNE